MSDLKTVDVVSSNGEPEPALSVPTDAEPSQARATSDLNAVEETVRRAMSERERLERLAVEIRQCTGREMATVAAAIAGATAEHERLQREASEQRERLERIKREAVQTEATIAAAVQQRERLARPAEGASDPVDRVLRDIAQHDGSIHAAEGERARPAEKAADLEARGAPELESPDTARASATADRDPLLTHSP